MNKLVKRVTVQFYSIDAGEGFLERFATDYTTNKVNSNTARILTLRAKKHLVKISGEIVLGGVKAYFATVVKERNTWQTKATSDGKISGIQLNQGIIGDPYYFCVVPEKKIVLGFTSGPSGSLKTVAATMLDQFNSDRVNRIKLDLIPKKKEFSALKELPDDSILHFNIKPLYLTDITDDAPKILKDLSSAPYIENSMQLSLQLEIGSSAEQNLSKETALEIISYLSEHESCSLLKVKGMDDRGNKISLDFGSAFVNHKTDIWTRDKFIKEEQAWEVLSEALGSYLEHH
ncbi:hypothetical protein [Pseudovibrio exalbescens]|uniref:Uncharacterized protein n=1 Tax=Pseudovibrio exalbescens TaxID=197461 RepID=A0A1U7JL26_9HYPH|nr:hypothetical protein [Pseudovibrio exalbescens]OKL45450.1 hypothetical protein A3843_03775 [Pseudovibrio exalbescens]